MAQEIEIAVPDIGDFEAVDVIDVLVHTGDVISPEDPLITLESDKATMDIPAPRAGRVLEVKVKVGDKVAQGHAILLLEPLGDDAPAPSAPTPAKTAEPPETATADRMKPPPVSPPGALAEPPASPPLPAQPSRYDFVSPDPGPRTTTPPAAGGALLGGGAGIYASPALRKFARELGVELNLVGGSGPKGRITREDVTAYVKRTLQQPVTGGPPTTAAPVVDFSKFGAIDIQPLTRIRRLTGQNLHRAWVTIPHVTQFDEADITELETFRQSQREEATQQGAKLTLVAFLLKAVGALLARHPDFNASLSADGESLVYKKYFHIGVAVNTARGLLVPVVRDVDRKGIYELARDVGALSSKAREGKLMPGEMQGGCFTITSLGGVSGTGFTPIINPPEVAILGISPATWKPVYRDGGFVPRLLLPLSLSYDHRVIDGVAAAEFTRDLGALIQDIRRLLL